MSPELTLKPLLGKTITSCEGATAGSEEIVFDTAEGPRYHMHHEQDCCERVEIHRVEGNISDIIGAPILSALESTSCENPPLNADSFTWTEFEIKTKLGCVKIRWLGESNGYYGEGVNFDEIKCHSAERSTEQFGDGNPAEYGDS